MYIAMFLYIMLIIYLVTLFMVCFGFYMVKSIYFSFMFCGFCKMFRKTSYHC